MTLYRQLIVFTLVLFLLLFTGTWVAKLESTRSFLMNQLESHAQDTATSLGLSISQHMAEGDMVAVESMINAVFDRGYYREVRLTDVQEKVLIDRTLDVTIENIPQWFVRLIPLKTPSATANVMAGWLQAGTIYVESHPGYAYKALWDTATRMTIWFAVTGVIVFIAGGFGLRILLQPLKRVELQAEALCRKQYTIQERLPRTRELRQVVEAMNRMTCKVKEMFEEQVGIAERLREHAYRDPLTGLGNRRYFEGQIKARLDRRGSTTKGIMLLFQINDLQQLNQQKGFQAGDEMIKRAAVVLQEETVHASSCALARLTGGDFGIFLPDASAWDAEAFAAGITNKIGQLAVEQLSLTDNVGHVGVAIYECTTTMARLLSEADLALRTAQQAGPNTWMVRTITEGSEDTLQGQQQWKEALEQALRERQVVLFAQPAVKVADRTRVLHLEVFSRIAQKDGSLLSAGVFMPFAERLKLVSTLDRIVLEKVLELDKAGIGVDSIAINVSPSSLQDDSFWEWTTTALRSLPKQAFRIIFEFAEFNAVQHLERVKEFSAMVRQLGHGVGLDHFGQSFSNLAYLQSLRPDYVKIDRAYIGELKDVASDSRFFIGSLCSVAHSLDIDVIAEGVENEQQWNMLKELNVDAMQGYFIDRPKPLDAGTKMG
ncbi:MAG: diguanylate cyclase [Deltaproteobacteria bacterium RIFOXYD12_FULL_57_12]|nr:MAG: diguanylate cyclase [Deltaproteobacteria bacterium RIFOXYD12_FULL_57_12]